MPGGAVLVADDDRINRRLLSKLLADEGYQPTTVVDGKEALGAIGRKRFDAVLLDIVMPEIDGLEVLRTLKGDSTLWHIPVIVISAVDEVESIVACLELGAEDYLTKPFDPVLLRARLNGCLARRRFGALEREYHKMIDEQAAELEALQRQVREQAWARSAVVRTAAPAEMTMTGPSAMPEEFRQAVAAAAERLGGRVVLATDDSLTVVFDG